MNKERLQDIKKKYNYERLGEFIDVKPVNPYELKWLIKQAERAQEYDRELISLEDNKHYVSEMLAKNKRYREAIEKIKEYNREALKDRNYTEIEALLEEIEKNLDPLGYEMSGHLVSANDIYWLVKYAKEQAERVQELEEEIEDWRKEVKKWQRFFREESQQNKQYRKTLEVIYDLAEYDEYDNTLEQIVSEIEKTLEGEE